MLWLAGSAIAGEVTATLVFDKPMYLPGGNILVRYRDGPAGGAGAVEGAVDGLR